MAKKSQKDKNDKKGAKAAPKRQREVAVQPTASPASTSQKPPAQLMDLVESFLSDQGFDDAHRAFKKHRATKPWKGHTTGKGGNGQSLVGIFQAWETFASKDSTPNATAQVTAKTSKVRKVSSSSDSSSSSSDSDSSSSDESSDDDDVAMADAPAADSSSSESSSSDSSSESDSDEEEDTASKRPALQVTPAAKSLKRKAESDSDSSSSDSDSDEEMTGSDSKDSKTPQTKRLKTEDSPGERSSESDSESDSSSDDSSDDEDVKPGKAKDTKKVESDSGSSSESDSDESTDSESGSEDEIAVAAKVPLPESDSDSSESESEAEKEKPRNKTASSKAANGAVSDSSATLEKASPESAPLPPDPTTFKANNRGKNGAASQRTQNQPFSRISKDVVVDPRLSSNAYVSHGYGEQAHRDLIVTKGKGFTKEKNKKKRGSYKGGPLDVHTSRSFKFDD